MKSLQFYSLKAPEILLWKQSVFKNLIKALSVESFKLQDGDIICISSKLFSIQQERAVSLNEVNPSEKAIALKEVSQLDPRLIEIIINESKEVLGVSPHSILTTNEYGMYSNAGVDMSNVPDERALLLPKDIDNEANAIRLKIEEQLDLKVAIIIIDTKSLPMKDGTMGSAIGISGITPIHDVRGTLDLFGKEYELTKINIVESISASANLLLGETNEQTPYVVVRGVEYLSNNISLSKTKIPKEYCLYFGPLFRALE